MDETVRSGTVNAETPLPKMLQDVSLHDLMRIDAGLEGDWSPTVVTVWSRDGGFMGFEGVTRTHPSYRPCLELYFEDSWLGLHCYTRSGAEYVFDEGFANRVIAYVEGVLKSRR
jgi:hypothetical protein